MRQHGVRRLPRPSGPRLACTVREVSGAITMHAEISLLAIGIGSVVAFFALMAFLAWANPGRNSGFLEWDPEEQAAWRGEVERADLQRMLEEHNVRRAHKGLDAQTMDEFRESLRKDAP